MATQEQHWERVKGAASQGLPYCSCLLDLRAKVDALEAKLASPPSIIVPSISDEHLETLKQPGRIEVLAPGDQIVAPPVGLVEMLTNLLGHHGDGTARAAIREVADWLEQRRAADSHWITVALLRQEANR
jgi:hypothetical protein